MTDNKPYVTDRELEEVPPFEVFAFHYTRDYDEEPEEFEWRFNAITGYRGVITYNQEAKPRAKFEKKDFYKYAYGSFRIVLQEPQFARYAKELAKVMLLVEPESIVVIDKKTGRFSGVWPQAERLQDRIRIDELDFFGMEGGDVVVR